MIKKIRKLLDTIALYRAHKDISRINPTDNALHSIFRIKHLYNKDIKGSARRNLLTSIIKQLRLVYPFNVEDYSKAKALYEEYFEMKNHIPSYEHIYGQVLHEEQVYVVNFRREAPIKGNNFNRYYINSSGEGSGRIYHLKDITHSETSNKKKYSYINMYSPKGFANVSGIGEDFFTNYRYATEEEIESFRVFEKKIKEVQVKLDYHQEKKQELYKELARYENCKLK